MVQPSNSTLVETSCVFVLSMSMMMDTHDIHVCNIIPVSRIPVNLVCVCSVLGNYGEHCLCNNWSRLNVIINAVFLDCSLMPVTSPFLAVHGAPGAGLGWAVRLSITSAPVIQIGDTYLV